MKANGRGAPWERMAEQYLKRQGFRTVSRNFHCRYGELDLIMRSGEILLFVEVRYRRSRRHGSPLETVDPHKQRRMTAAAKAFLGQNPRLAMLPGRFDCVGISGPVSEPLLEWVPDAFEAW